MLKRFLLLSAGLLAGRVSAQSALPNDPDPTRWINYRQAYFKLPVAQAGLYRVTVTELAQAGISLGSVDPTTVQVFHRGVELAIAVEGERDHRFDPADFVEFYGRGNDGAPDSLLYRPTSAQPHAHYSLFSDTTAYFLTWRLDGKPGRRMATYADTDYAGLTPEPYHWAEELRLFTDTYPGYAAGIPPKIEYSHFEAGEGYTGVVQHKDKPAHYPFALTNAVRTGPAPQLAVLLVGRDYPSHRVECLVGATIDAQRLLDSTVFSGYDNARIRQNVAWTDVGADGRLLVSTVSRGNGFDADRYSVSLIELRYPQIFTASNQPQCRFQLAPNPAGRSLLDVSQVPTDARFYDITDPTAPVRVIATRPAVGAARLVVPNSNVARTLLSTSQPKSVAAIRPVTFPNWSTRKPTYLIVSHEALMQPVSTPTAGGETNAVRAYAAYRASTAGGGHDTLTATMQQLIDQFSYGERHPLAIRRFAAQMLRQGPVQYLLLLGRARSTPGVRRDPNQATLDLVMTYGFPGSDVVFTAGLEGPGLEGPGLDSQPDDVPAIPTGRVNAGTPQEVLNYLNKVKEYENQSAGALWRKTILHLSGGQTATEAGLFRGLVDAYRDQAVMPWLGARVTTLSKETDNPVERIDVVGPVNEGVGVMTFFGHSGLDVTDLDIGFCSNDALGYRNRGKYPFLLINGCAIGNFFFGRPTLTTDWVLTPDRGAIASIAQSHLGYVGNLHDYSTQFYSLLTDSTQLHKSIGQLQQETIRRALAQTPGGLNLANAQQMVLQGDPAIRLFPFETPDYVLTAGGLSIRGPANQPLTTLSDSVVIRAVVENAGQYRSGPLPIRVRRLVNGRESGVYNLNLPRAVAYRDTLVLTLPNERDADGSNQFEVTVNPTDAGGTPRLPETNLFNNRAVTEVNVASQQPVLIYPAPGGLVQTTTVRLTAEYRTDAPRLFDLELDSTARFDSPSHPVHRLTATGVITFVTTLPASTLR